MDKISELKELITHLEIENRYIRREKAILYTKIESLKVEIENLKEHVKILEETSSNNFTPYNIYDARI
jgi:predicted RNase H-like nuclease (RuvC/YqgF family)